MKYAKLHTKYRTTEPVTFYTIKLLNYIPSPTLRSTKTPSAELCNGLNSFSNLYTIKKYKFKSIKCTTSFFFQYLKLYVTTYAKFRMPSSGAINAQNVQNSSATSYLLGRSSSNLPSLYSSNVPS